MSTIDPARFAAVWEVLCQRFGRKPDVQEATMYRVWLEAQRLSTRDVEIAATDIWAADRFFPRPTDFMRAYQHVPPAYVAMNAWDLVQQAVSGDLDRDEVAEITGRFDARTRVTVKLLGGLETIRDTPAKQLPFVRQEFIRYHSLQTEHHLTSTAQRRAAAQDFTLIGHGPGRSQPARLTAPKPADLEKSTAAAADLPDKPPQPFPVGPEDFE